MGYEVARKAGQIADFFRNIFLVSYDTYTTNKLGDYVEGAIREGISAKNRCMTICT